MERSAPAAALLRRLDASALFMDAGFFLTLAAIPYKVLALGGGPLALGAIPAVSSVTYIAGTLSAGRRTDRSRRLGLTLWGAAFVLAFALVALRARGLVALAAYMPLLGGGIALYWPAVQAAVGDLAPPGALAREIGRFNLAWCVGKAGGFALGGALLAGAGFPAAFAVGAVLMGVAYALLPRARAVAPAAAAAPGAETAAPPPRARDAFRRMAWIANFAAFGAGGVLNHQLPKWFAASGWNEARFGLFLGAVFLAQAAAFALLAGRVRFAWSVRRLVLPQVAAGIAIAALPLAGGWLGVLATAPVLGGAFGVCYSASIFYSLHATEGKGRNAGIHEALVGAGNFAVPLLAGVAARATARLEAPYAFAALVIALAVAAQLVLAARLRRKA